MPLVYRPAREQDLERAQELVVRSINELTERHGFGTMAVVRPTKFQSFSLKDDPDGLWVAEAMKSLALPSVGCVGNYGFSRSCSCLPLTRAAASGVNF